MEINNYFSTKSYISKIHIHLEYGKKTFLSILFISCLLFAFKTSAFENQPEKEIVLGMSTALTGPAAELGKNMLLGVRVALERVNSRGGINGRSLDIVALDDGYEPDRTTPNIIQLIKQDKVLAIIGNVGTPTAIAALPIIEKEKILLFAPFTGAGLLRSEPPDRYVINYRASYTEETEAMVDALIEKGKLQPDEIAFFTQRDGYGDAGYASAMKALKRHGLKDDSSIMHVRYERNSLAVENAVADILLKQTLPKAIIIIGTYAPAAKFINLASSSGIDALFLNISFVGSSVLAEKLQNNKHKVIVTQVVPSPTNKSLVIVRDYLHDLQNYDSKAKPSYISLEGYIATRILVKAIKKIDAEPTRENIIDALESLNSFDIGLGKMLNLSRKNHQASHQVWPTKLTGSTFTEFDWSQISHLLTGQKK